MSLRWTSACLAVLALSAIAGEDAAKELDKLKGSWLVTGGEAEGKPVPEDEVKKKVVITFAATKLSLTEAGMRDKVELDYTLNPARKPKEIDIIPETADRGVIRGIYLVDGDVLKICLGEPGKERPTKFEAKAGSGHKLMELRRVKP